MGVKFVYLLYRKKWRAKRRVLQQANSMMMKLFGIEDKSAVKTPSIVSDLDSSVIPGRVLSLCESNSNSNMKVFSSPLRWPPKQSLIPKRLKITESQESTFALEDFDSYDFVVTSEEVCF